MRKNLFVMVVLVSLTSCNKIESGVDEPFALPESLELSDVAMILSNLPLGQEHLEEVYDAVASSSGNGYDEEYMLSDLFDTPGSGVGAGSEPTRAAAYSRPMKDLFEEYFRTNGRKTKSGASDVEAYISALSESDIQIYWPYSEYWDGTSYPVVTFDPGYGAEVNKGYEMAFGPDGAKVVGTVLVDEEMARNRPVWVINRNDDADYTPARMLEESSRLSTKASEDGPHMLTLKYFTALRNYDSWFGGASEFLVKCGAVDGFKASTDDELKNYHPSVTDFVVVVKRSHIGKSIPFEAILLTDFTEQMEKIVFAVMEDDGGTRTSWHCEATVKYNSKTTGFSIEIPYREKDDIVWRGSLDRSFFTVGGRKTGRFGDAIITFELQ